MQGLGHVYEVDRGMQALYRTSPFDEAGPLTVTKQRPTSPAGETSLARWTLAYTHYARVAFTPDQECGEMWYV